MGVTKTNLFSERQNRLAILAKALGHPARIAIIEHVFKTNNCINHDLVQELGLAQATVSQHLKELKKIGILQGTVEGKAMCYCIDVETWSYIKKELNSFFDADISCNSNNCC